MHANSTLLWIVTMGRANFSAQNNHCCGQMLYEVAAQVKPIYERLGHTDLLSQCLKGATQNANESLPAMVWAKCPKTDFVGTDRVLFATCCAVGECNSGAQVTAEHLYGAMGLATGQQLISSAAKADRKRLGKSLHQEATCIKEA